MILLFNLKMFVFFLQTLLKELEEFAHKGIPDVRGCKVQDAMILEEMVGILLIYISFIVRKPVFGVSDQVRHKLGCTAIEDG